MLFKSNWHDLGVGKGPTGVKVDPVLYRDGSPEAGPNVSENEKNARENNTLPGHDAQPVPRHAIAPGGPWSSWEGLLREVLQRVDLEMGASAWFELGEVPDERLLDAKEGTPPLSDAALLLQGVVHFYRS